MSKLKLTCIHCKSVWKKGDESCYICSKVITTVKEWIQSYKNNNNTGNDYEIRTGLALLLGSGLITNNHLPEEYKTVKPYKVSSKLKGLINLTQIDNIGGTADVGLLFHDKPIKFFSVTEYKSKTPSKCICNPSGTKYYGVVKSEVIEAKNEEAFNIAIQYRKENFGELPNKKWKRTPNCPGSKMVPEFLAKEASNSWMSMSEKIRKDKLAKMLDLDNTRNTNADGIIFWNKKKHCIEKIYKWRLAIDLSTYLTTYSEGIYIYHGTPADYILRTQAKYNNGIIEGMKSKFPIDQWKPKKSTCYLSSWDCVAPDLNKIFNMEEVHLIE